MTDQAIRGIRLDTENSGDLNDVIAPVWINNETESIDYYDKTGSIFYANTRDDTIEEVKSDGSVNTLIRWVKGIHGIALDWTNDMIYYTDRGKHAIGVISMDGSRRVVILQLPGDSDPIDIVLHLNTRCDLSPWQRSTCLLLYSCFL